MNKKPIFLDIETTGLNPTYGNRITAICAKAGNDEFKQTHIYEMNILDEFNKFMHLHPKEDYKLVTKNGKMFDIPFIVNRWVQQPANYEDIKYLVDYEHFDIQEITKKRISLADMTRFYGIQNKSASGLEAIEFWKNKEYQKIVNYCWDDVLITEKVYNIYNKLKKEGGM